jgi:hypothetical protein
MPKRSVKSVLVGRKARAVFYFMLASGAYLFLPKLPELAGHLLQVIVVITVVNLLERFVLWNEFIHLHREATREVGKSLSQVVGAAVECGLTGIYVNRKKSIPDVKEAIAGARLKVWLLGVGFAAELSLHELAPILSYQVLVSLCHNCARILSFPRIRVSFERKADAPICWKH